LNQAVARDPSFSKPTVKLVWVHDFLYIVGHDHTPARLELAEAAVQSAFRLQPDAGEAHLARAEIFTEDTSIMTARWRNWKLQPASAERVARLRTARLHRAAPGQNTKRRCAVSSAQLISIREIFFTLQQIANSYIPAATLCGRKIGLGSRARGRAERSRDEGSERMDRLGWKKSPPEKKNKPR